MDLTRTCPWCGKVSHATRAAALWFARRMSGGMRLRVYRCPAGQGWHLTSKRPHRRRRAVRRPPRACLREPGLPAARLDGPAREVKLLSDHRRHLVTERTILCNRLRWHLHELDPRCRSPPAARAATA